MTPFQIKRLIDLTPTKNKFTFVLCLFFFALVQSLINCQMSCDPPIFYMKIRPILEPVKGGATPETPGCVFIR